MTNPLIPYSFIPGTKAKAQEVNANFISVAEELQDTQQNMTEHFENIDNSIGQIQEDYEQVYEDCADKNLINTNMLTSYIIDAPNGVATYSNLSITIKSGIRAMLPDGRNSNGSLKNTEYTLENDITYTHTVNNKNEYYYIGIYNNNSPVEFPKKNVFNVSKLTDRPTPTTENNYYVYVEETNLWYGNNKTTTYTELEPLIIIGQFYENNKQITQFKPKTTFHLFDYYNNKSLISGLDMPSNKYIELTFGSSGTQYTAPANGYFYAKSKASGTGQYLTLNILFSDSPMATMVTTPTSTALVRTYIPCKKGDSVQLLYTTGGSSTNNGIYFRYAEGEV